MIDWPTALRIRKNIKDASPVPVSMHINITGRCPCRCWHCEKATNRDGKDLAWSTLIECLDQAQQWGCSVLYTGGEPLVHHQWRELLQAGMERGLKQSLITCGVGLSSLSLPDRQLLHDSLDELLISIDSADPSTHDQLRGIDGLFNNVMGYLEEQPRPHNIWFVHVPQPDFASVQPMLEMAAKHSVGLIVQPYIFNSNFPHLQSLETKGDIPDLLEKISAQTAQRAKKQALVAAKLKVISNLEEVALYVGHYYQRAKAGKWFASEVLPEFLCSVPWQQVTIDEFGCVLPCVFLQGKPKPQEVSLADHWQQQALAFREKQVSGQTWPECRSCSCHFSSNYRNSLLLYPWANRQGWSIVFRKKIMKLLHRINPSGRS